MIKKIFFIFLGVLYGLIHIGVVEAQANLLEKYGLEIISRADWGANEEWRYADSQEWKDIFEKNKQYAIDHPQSDEQKEISQKQAEKRKNIETIIFDKKYDEKHLLSTTITQENNRPLSWPIQKTHTIKSIIVHHTASSYQDSYEGIKSIYKYHTLSRQWGDIGYNYIIGNNGEIFEGRAGGETAVGAHVSWNNRSNLGISLMGNFNNSLPSEKQMESLENLIKYLAEKYNIDLNQKSYFHKECISDVCDIPVESYLAYNMIGHTDAGHTNCPGDLFHADFNSFRLGLLGKQKVNVQKIHSVLDTFSDNKLLDLQNLLEKEYDKKNNLYLYQVKKITLEYAKKRFHTILGSDQMISLQKNIKVKLSYPHNDFITISDGSEIYSITKHGNTLMLNGESYNALKIDASQVRNYLEITSWERIPSWDKNKVYNDNKFRGELILYVQDNKITVVNHLKLEDYLKGLGEVSNGDQREKVKTIILSARTYAQWYMDFARKFEGEFYDASDNPDEFQKYLGYSLERRSPNINKIVEETQGQYITYNGQIIKPWYSSRTNGKTLSYKQYCFQNGGGKCEEYITDYPYLQSVEDLGSIGMSRLGHGVGVSGNGASYFAQKGWSAEMIIAYYLRDTKINQY